VGQVTDTILHADEDELINALVRRGAITKRLSGDRLKLSIVFQPRKTAPVGKMPVTKRLAAQSKQARRLRRAIASHDPSLPVAA